MIDQLKKKLEELEIKKAEVQPKIEELNAKKEEEIEALNQKYYHLTSEVNIDVENFEREIYNDFIISYVDCVMEEFDAKRSISDYTVTDTFKEYREDIATVDIFPKELIEKMDKVISGEAQIESIAYYIDDIKAKYLKT
jgi:hypothetical protein